MNTGRPAPHPTSTGAAARLLDRAPSAQDLAQATANVARRADGDDAQAQTVFVFRLGAEWLGLPSGLVDEVLAPRVVHVLPHRREGVVRGLVNVRGRLTLCITLEALLHAGSDAAAAPAPAARGGVLGRRLVVLASGEHRLAFEADEVHGTHRHALAAVGNVPATVAQGVARFSTGVITWEGRPVGLLDAPLLLHAVQRRLG